MDAQNLTDESNDGEANTEETAVPDTELTRDDIFHVLQCRRRRLVLKYLQEYDGEGPARMGDIAEHIAALEHDTTVDALRSQQRQRVYIALYQSHLEKMDEDGILNYNKSRGYVEATERAEQFDAYLENEPVLLGDEANGEESPETAIEESTTETHADVEARWYKRYLYAAGGSLLAVTAVSSGVMSSVVLSEIGVGILVSFLFTLLAVTHWVTESAEAETELNTPAIHDRIQ